MDFSNLEGGCWGVAGDDGTDFQPTGVLDPAFHQQGLRVYVEGRISQNMAGFCPGVILEISLSEPLP
jgi:hypothetical protein